MSQFQTISKKQEEKKILTENKYDRSYIFIIFIYEMSQVTIQHFVQDCMCTQSDQSLSKAG